MVRNKRRTDRPVVAGKPHRADLVAKGYRTLPRPTTEFPASRVSSRAIAFFEARAGDYQAKRATTVWMRALHLGRKTQRLRVLARLAPLRNSLVYLRRGPVRGPNGFGEKLFSMPNYCIDTK